MKANPNLANLAIGGGHVKSATVKSAALRGVEVHAVSVWAEVSDGPASLKIVGIPEAAAKEASVRVRCALESVGHKLSGKVAVMVDPPVRSAAHLDLPIAVAILAASGDNSMVLDGVILAGELALDGRIRRISGSLPIALWAKGKGVRSIILPSDSANEAFLAQGDALDASKGSLAVYGSVAFADVIAHLRGEILLENAWDVRAVCRSNVDLSGIRGLETAKRALEIAAAGGHSILLVGPPGSGKTLLARCLAGILPPMTDAEALEAACVYSAAGKLEGASGLASRPFRAPHHDVSVAGLIGGGSVLRPGEVTLAHRGVLFLDELPEFKRSALDALRQPILDRRVTLIRAHEAFIYPANFMLVAAMNPCPCGYRGSSLRLCTCSEDRVRRYVGRFEGPDFDLYVDVPHVDYRTLRGTREGESSADVRGRVVAAREVQRIRFQGSGRASNAEMGPGLLREHCELDSAADWHLEACVKRFALSGRAVYRILRVARTIADLAGHEKISASDVAEAITFQRLES